MHVGINSLFLNRYGVGGIGVYLRCVLQEMTLLDDTVTWTVFVNRENSGLFSRDFNSRVREVVCPVHASNRPLRLAYEYGILPLQAQSHGVNVLFSPAFTAPTRRGYVSVVTVHDMRHEDLPETFPRAHRLSLTLCTRRSVRSAAQILTDSEHARGRILANYRVAPERVSVAPLAADARYFERLTQAAIEHVWAAHALLPPYLLTFAAPGYQKNLDTLVDAFIALRREGATPVRLAVIGTHTGIIEGLQQRVADAGLASEMRALGWVENVDLPALYQGAAAFVMPSRYEGFGLPVLEAMASGVPVVTTTATALPEVAGDAALLVDPDDAAGMAAALGRLLEDGELRRGLIARGEARARQFTWEKTAATTLAVLRRAFATR